MFYASQKRLFSSAVGIALDGADPFRLFLFSDPLFAFLANEAIATEELEKYSVSEIRGYTDRLIGAVATSTDRRRQWAATYLLGFLFHLRESCPSCLDDREAYGPTFEAVVGQLVTEKGQRALKVLAGLLQDRPATWIADVELALQTPYWLAMHGSGKYVLDAGFIPAMVSVLRGVQSLPQASRKTARAVNVLDTLVERNEQAFVETAASHEELMDVLIKCLVAIKGGKISEEEDAAAKILGAIESLLSYGARQVAARKWDTDRFEGRWNRTAMSLSKGELRALQSVYDMSVLNEKERTTQWPSHGWFVLATFCAVNFLVAVGRWWPGRSGTAGRSGNRCRTSRATQAATYALDPQEQANRAARATAQLKNDIHDASNRKHSLSCRYEELSDAHRRAVERKKQLQEAIREMKGNTIPELSSDVLASCESAADAHAFADKVKQEHERLDQLYDQINAAERTGIKLLGIPMESLDCEDGSTAATGASSPVSASSSHSREASVSAEPPATEAQLRKTLQTLKGDIRKLESGIAAMRVNCDRVRASLQPLEQEHDTLVQEAAKGLTKQRLATLSSSAAVSAFKAEVKQRQRQLLALYADASKLEGRLQEREAPPAADRGTCVLCLDQPPTVVYFPCKQQCACAGCHERLMRTHEAAKREKQRLERTRRRVPDDVKRDAVLRCPACRTEAEYASDLHGVRCTT
ncbi:unnamed protein product [Vitrella brassicaformis CCMP3155]|uniref:Uncharacterized protein n=2 Tax=Vitrella brassicaformis TaxID=1169539 RepID=A0A0G4GAK9_VITBC|nr:unnamed protein product [Vitrella brassicaformis CCMP3155]|eukprot:CEM26009.1 unnamed protein product [Vitrella brassicaformis CCMP3155]